MQTTVGSAERVALALRSLYNQYGYAQYKMSKFEEYDLYVRNKDFLVSDSVITFTDTSGKLMALKPDVTLSIIKNGKDQKGSVEKVYYNENVYRVSKNTHEFKEIMQTGLECIGDIGIKEVCEVTELAIKSLETIDNDFVLDISYMDIILSVLSDSGLDSQQTSKILKAIGENPLLQGVTFSGGEPFFQAEAFAELGAEIKKRGLHITTYSGYTFEQIISGIEAGKTGWKELLSVTDLLVDGKFIIEEKSLNLLFRGSKNQRLINVPKSLDAGEVVLWDPEEESGVLRYKK